MMDMQIVVHKYPEANVIYMQGSYYVSGSKISDKCSVLLGMGDSPEEAWADAARIVRSESNNKTWKTNNEL
jgi:hypothetical protein